MCGKLYKRKGKTEGFEKMGVSLVRIYDMLNIAKCLICLSVLLRMGILMSKYTRKNLYNVFHVVLMNKQNY